MPFKCLDTSLRLIIPDFDNLVVCPRKQIRSITTGVVVDAIDTTFMALEGKVRLMCIDSPNFDAPVQRC